MRARAMKPGGARDERAGADPGYQTIPTPAGVRLVQHGTVLSVVLGRPGPTHSVVDVIAASVQAAAFGPRIAMLGFAGGGMLAPLRAMGGRQAVAAVDLEDSGWRVFRRLCAPWAGPVKFERVEACTWLRGSTRRYDVIIEDLSTTFHGNVCKPPETWSKLPSLVCRRLSADGVAIFNLLRPTDGSWEGGIRRIMRSGYIARLVCFAEYENRLLIVGKKLPEARQLSRDMRASLRSIRSRLASRISVRTCMNPPVADG